jgi:flagellar hook assembly protein FlgD
VTIAGQAASLSNATGSPAAWSLSASAPATANVTITSATGQTAYTGTLALNSGAQSLTWNGRGNNGVTWLDGSYTISISATGANGQPGRRLDTCARRCQRRRCRPDPASAHRGRAKGADQPDPIDQR